MKINRALGEACRQACIPALFTGAAVVTAVAAIGGTLPARAQGDVALDLEIERGKNLARVWCSECHVVDAGESVAARTEAPALAEIASRPERTRETLDLFLMQPHPPMPDLQLTNDERRDLTSYILSLGDEMPAK